MLQDRVVVVAEDVHSLKGELTGSSDILIYSCEIAQVSVFTVVLLKLLHVLSQKYM